MLCFLVVSPDVDECKDSSNGCDGECMNTKGSYDCVCSRGRAWSAKNQSCEGILCT